MNPLHYYASVTACVAALAIALTAPSAAFSELAFTDVTATATVRLPETLNESIAWGDYDNDGDQDLFLTNDGPNALFRNDGGDVFVDVTAEAGVTGAGFSVGAAFGDLDNDGDLDLYVVTFGAGPDLLFRNDGPLGPTRAYVFTEIATEAGIDQTVSSRPVALLDFDRDGLLDIFVMSIGQNILYRNLGGLRFENVAVERGVGDTFVGVGAVATDIDDDGWPDLFTGNRSAQINSLYKNDEGTFVDIAAGAGIDSTGLGMGVLSFDYDNDLDFDLYWTTWPGSGAAPVANALYENLNGESFVDVAEASGTEDALGWGISANAGDIDNDGWTDFFVTNGFSTTSSANVLFHNLGDKTFADRTDALGGGDFDGRGVAFADYDDDGDLDLIVTGGVTADTHLWRNDGDDGHHWLTLNLVGTVSNASAIGARVTVETAARTTVHEVSGGAGRGSQNSLPVEIGLGAEQSVVGVGIDWPSGMHQELGAIDVDRAHRVVEPLLAGLPGRRFRADTGLGNVARVRTRSLDHRVRLGLGKDSIHDPSVHGGTLSILPTGAGERGQAGGALTVELPAGQWKTRRRAGVTERYRYKGNPAVAPGAHRISVRPGKLRIVARTDPALLDSDPGPVATRLTLGEAVYCLEFGGIRRFRQFTVLFARDAAAPECAAPSLRSTSER